MCLQREEKVWVDLRPVNQLRYKERLMVTSSQEEASSFCVGS